MTRFNGLRLSHGHTTIMVTCASQSQSPDVAAWHVSLCHMLPLLARPFWLFDELSETQRGCKEVSRFSEEDKRILARGEGSSEASGKEKPFIAGTPGACWNGMLLSQPRSSQAQMFMEADGGSLQSLYRMI